MIGIKEAFASATKFLRDLYGEHVYNVELEEVEMSEDDAYWFITLGFTRGDPIDLVDLDTPLRIQGLFPRRPPEEFKVFKIDANTGIVKSMKIRTPQTTL